MSSARKPSRSAVKLIVAGTALTLLTVLLFILPVPYSTMSPGPIIDTLGEIDGQPLLEFGDDVITYPTEGSLDFTTVSVSRAQSQLSLVGALRAWASPDTAVVPRSFLYEEGQTNEEASEQGAAQLSSSQDASRAAALRALGEDVTEVPSVAVVMEGSPAEGIVNEGDILLAVDGQLVETGAEAAQLIGERSPGDTVAIMVERDGQETDLSVTTVAGEDDPQRPMVGIVISSEFVFPIEIENNIGDRVGGPSAGMMFALAIYDRLTPGPLNGGLNVAGTGSIDPDGVVGGIGGIQQKLAGASAEETDVFLVPEANCAAAADFESDMVLVRVQTLDDAIDALTALAEDIDAEVPSC